VSLALTILLAAAPSFAADLDRPLTWEDCVAMASARNPELAASALSVDSSRASFYGSFNGLLPKLSLSNSYSDSKASDGSSRWSAQGSLSMDVFNMGSVNSVRSAWAGLGQARASQRSASSSLRLNLRRAFAQLLFAQRIVEVSRSIRDLRDKDSQLVVLRYDSGRESKGNMLRSKAQVLQAEADLSQDLRDLRTAQRALDRYLGIDEFSAVTASGTLGARPAPDFPKDLKALAVGRPDVAVQEASVRSAQVALSQSRASLWPSVSVNYSRSRTGREEFPYSRYNWSFGGSLSYALFGGGPTAAYFASAASKKSLEKAREDLRSVRNQAMLDLETAWSQYSGAVEQTKVQELLLEAARLRNSESDVRYESGLLNFENWETIVSERVNSERQAIQAQLSAAQAEAAWEKALGKALGE